MPPQKNFGGLYEKKNCGGGNRGFRKLKSGLKFTGLAILFLFTITCSLTSVILAALTANVGSSFSIFYEPKPQKSTTVLPNLTEDAARYMWDERPVYGGDNDIVIFDYWDNTELVTALFGDGTWYQITEEIASAYGYVNNVGVYYVDGNSIGLDFGCCLFLSDDDIYAPEDSSDYFDIVTRHIPDCKLYLNNFHTENVVNATQMFPDFSCDLNLSNLDFSKASGDEMFYRCKGKVYISESLLNNENINNPDANPELYESTHDEYGRIHMTSGQWDYSQGILDETTASQFTLPALDLQVFAGRLSQVKLYNDSGNLNMLELAMNLAFDTYTAPGEYVDANGNQIVLNYGMVGAYSAIMDVIGGGDLCLFNQDDIIKLYITLGDDSGINIDYAGVYVLCNKPIYLINARSTDMNYIQQTFLSGFRNGKNEGFVSVFDNLNVDYAY